jgi:hypothetical protein
MPYFQNICTRAGHFRYKYRYFDIRYLSDTEKSTGIEISDLKSIGISCIVSVADPGCLSRIPDPDPTIFWYPGSGSDLFYPGSRIRILQIREGKN